MPARVKLCAIAKNEGAYLADWVFHHLHFGFDAVEVWVNATEDPSLRILKRIGERHPQVTGRRADQLLEECLEQGTIFQHRAYARMARKARRDGFTHAAFLDLDEYWTPRDLTSPIAAFLPDDPDVNVVSFPWAVDVPDPQRPPFLPPFAGPLWLQLDAHVKSVVRLDDTVERIHAHTARTRGGTRLLVRDAFPLVDPVAQAGGSLVTDDDLVRQWGALPEAFVVHAVNRSPGEYVGSLAKGMLQTGSGMVVKSNRFGFVPTEAPALLLEPAPAARGDYERARQSFLAGVDVAEPTRRASRLLTDRGSTLMRRLVEEEPLMAELRGALRGIPAPLLDRAYPGWDSRVAWWVDSVDVREGRTVVTGWAFSTPTPGELEVGFRDAAGVDQVAAPTWRPRPEVAQEYPGAPADCGFEVEVPGPLAADLAGVMLLVRPRGSTVWEATRLRLRTASTRG